MISGLLNNLIGQYNLANAPNPAPATSDPNNLAGLLQTTGIPMTQNPMGMRTPDYMSLLGMMGQQPFTPGYTPIGGGSPVGTATSDYLSRVSSPAPVQQRQVGNNAGLLNQLVSAGLMVKQKPNWLGTAWRAAAGDRGLNQSNYVDGYVYRPAWQAARDWDDGSPGQ